jgi:hypothetical protein
MAAKLARELHQPALDRNIVDEDEIFAGTPPNDDPGLAGLSAVRFPSVAAAKRAQSSGVQFLTESIPANVRSALPADFDSKRVAEARVCNVVVASYNPDVAPAVSRRFNRVVTLLRSRC